MTVECHMLAMRLRHSFVATLLLQLFAGEAFAIGQSAGLLDLTGHIHTQHHHQDYAKQHYSHQYLLHDHRRRSVEDYMARGVANTLGRLERRQDDSSASSSSSSSSSQSSSSDASSSPSTASPPASGDGSDVSSSDIALWNEQTSAVCLDALRSIDGDSTNPSGISVCYNLPFFDEETGVFQAELRMYNVSAPFDEWQGVVAADIALELSFTGASAQIVNNPPSRRRLLRRQDLQQSSPEEMKVLSYIGQVDEDVVEADLSLAELRPIVLPAIVLSARNPAGEDITTTLSSSDSSFLNGVFSLSSSDGDSSPTRISDEAARSSASAIVESITAEAKVEIPGVTLGVFPVGMVVTLVWTALFVAAFGYGTFMRMKYRDQYRRRRRRAVWKGVAH